MDLFCYVGLWLLCGFVAASITNGRGSGSGIGMLLGILFGPLGILFALLVPRNEQGLEQQRLESGELRKCNRCAELIKAEALVCRYCGQQYNRADQPPVAGGAWPSRPKDIRPLLNRPAFWYGTGGAALVCGIVFGALAWSTITTVAAVAFPISSAPPSAPAVSKATISGRFRYPSDGFPTMRVCVERTDRRTIDRCVSEDFGQQADPGYTLTVEPGAYRVYATTLDQPSYRAYYSEFVRCGLSVDCDSHRPIVVTVRAGEVVRDIDPADWYAPPQ